MDDILLWSKEQMANFGPKPKQVLAATLFKSIKNQFSSYESITFSFENPENLLLTTDEDYLKTIMRNLTANAVNVLHEKPNASIIWKAWKIDTVNYLSIQDNGLGTSIEKFKPLFNDHEIPGGKTGLGMHLIKDLAKAINCKIEVDSYENLGSTIILIFN